ncbi:MAG: exodeoxyribonuclease V subunit alpha, partial [Acidimicrobiales bacterium]
MRAPPEAVAGDERQLAWAAAGTLGAFNQAGVLALADVHVARRLGALVGVEDEAVLLGLALAVRAPRLGHVCVDITTASRTVSAADGTPAGTASLPWPPVGEWLARLHASPMVAVGDDGPTGRPLRLVGSLLYLDRYWHQERRVAS